MITLSALAATLTLVLYSLSKNSLWSEPEAPRLARLADVNSSLMPLNSPLPSTSSQVGIPPTSAAQETHSPQDEPGLSCWDTINHQIESHNFFENHKQHLYELAGEWYFARGNLPSLEVGSDTVSSPQEKFLLALAKAGLLDGKSLKRDDEEALRLLGEVRALDPTNSAPLLYAAIIESARGHKERANELFRQARKSDVFDTYITTISKSLFSKVETPEDLIQAYSLWSTLPIPNYSALHKFLKDRDGEMFAHQLTSVGLDNSVLSDIEWIPLEYAIGRSLLQSYRQDQKLPTYPEILELKSAQSLVDGDRLYSELQTSCDSSALRPLVDTLKTRLALYR